MADVESDIEQENSIEDPRCPEPWDLSAGQPVFGLSRPIRKSNRQAAKVMMTLDAIEARMNTGVTNKENTKHHCFTSFFMYLE